LARLITNIMVKDWRSAANLVDICGNKRLLSDRI